MSDITIPLFEPDLTEQDKKAVQDVLDSGWITMGPRVSEFEKKFANFVGAKHAVAVNSCTAALHLAQAIIDIGPGDEVIVPSLTFAATANTVAQTGATPIFADVKSLNDWTIDPADVTQKITRRTKAVIPMHYAGYACDMAALNELKDVTIIEDAAHGLTGNLDGKHLGTLSEVGCYSFFSNKVMTTAEGGMLVTEDENLATRARQLRSHGQTKTAIDRMQGSLGYDISEVGFNYRLDDIRAGLGLSQMDRLEENLHIRQKLIVRYQAHLTDIERIDFPNHGGRGNSAHYILPIRLIDGDRDGLRIRMAEKGVQTSLHYPPIHRFAHYRDNSPELPITDKIAETTLTLPLFPSMTENHVDQVVKVLTDCLNA
jgi:dTDP-4-amino-4,6-dideoxygalactose transaminase